MSEIQKADRRAVRTAVAVVVCGALVGLALLTFSRRNGEAFGFWLPADLSGRLTLVLGIQMALFTVPLLAMAGYVWHLGGRIVRAQRYPPPGMRLVRNTPIVVGDAAVRRGRVAQALAASLGVAAVLLAFVLWRLLASVGAWSP